MTLSRAISILTSGALACALAARGQTTDLVPVVAKQVSRTAELPGEMQPFLSVSLRANIAGYVERVLVDRGSVVKEGQLLVELRAPEIAAQIAEGQSKVQTAESDRLQAEAQLAASQSTYERLKKAAETPGAIAGNELVQAEKQVEANQALVRSRQQAMRTAQAAVDAQKELQAYLRIIAPFDGVITDRQVHPGTLVGRGSDPVLLVLQQISQLRLVVAVPEEDVGGITTGANVGFRVPAYTERKYAGTVARVSHVLDKASRTMPVELDVANRDGTLAPGMYATVTWPIHRSRPALFVPKTSVVTTAERTFVIRNQNGRAQWVDVRKGAADGDLLEITGELKPGEMVVRRATDELREGTPIQAASK